ncbi:NAD-dependent deacylase [bacterium]|nr:NAD-dependent deacylase [bacterium]
MTLQSSISSLVKQLASTQKVTVLSGAGISAESGIPTFRGKEGLWKKYRAQDLATLSSFMKDPKLVWEWYDWRRKIIASKEPNPGHKILAKWENYFPSFVLITQNVDGLHQKAGSQNVLELHGNIWKLRCTQEGTLFENHEVPLKELPPRCPQCGGLLRPHVVWFGESLPTTTLNKAFTESSRCEMMFSIGTSAVVQPAASLPLKAVESGAKVVEINPVSTPVTSYSEFSFRGNAGEILPQIDKKLPSEHL